MNKQLRGSFMLFLTAFIWGTAFVAQKSGMDTISPVAFNGIRTIIGGIALLPVIAILSQRKGRSGAASQPDAGGQAAGAIPMQASDSAASSAHASEAAESAAEAQNRRAGQPLEEGTTEAPAPAKPADTRSDRKLLWIGGICCGLFLMAAGNVQQIGMYYTTAGKTGFVTALYVILVPIAGLFLGKKIRPIFWACVAASAVGLYLLCIPAGGGFGGINKGDIIVFFCAILFAGHILCIDYFSPKVDGVKLSCIQFFVAGGLSCLLMLFIDPAMGFTLPTLADLQAGWFQLFYAGVMSCGVAYTLQVVAQKDVNPTVASMLLCLESVFAVLAGAVLLGEGLGLREIIGCVLMFAAILVAQLPGKEE